MTRSRMTNNLWVVCRYHGRAWIVENPEPKCLLCEEKKTDD